MHPDADRRLTDARSARRATEDDWLDRFAAEADFAEDLAALLGGDAADWPEQIAAARAGVAEALRGARPAEDAVREAETSLAEIGEVAKGYTLYCLGHAHIDMNWQWSWPETVATINDTLSTVLALMEEFEEFHFAQSQTSVYAAAAKYCPDLFERIRRRVAEGRWEVTAAEWVEGDKNIVTGESLARHLLYARAWMRERMDLEPSDLPLAWNPDTFGHANTIPGILSRGGVSRYYFCRGGYPPAPPVFRWVGADGRSVLATRETTWYIDVVGPHIARALVRFLREVDRPELRCWLCVYGVGDHGGGPTRRDLHRLRDLATWPIFPTLEHATSRPFYEALEAQGDAWPTVRRELNFEFPGCYTSQSRIKQTNRLADRRLREAEIAATLGWATLARDYPRRELRDAWADTLFGHFHDILPGSCTREPREWHLGRFQETAAVCGMTTTHNLRALAARIDTRLGEGDRSDARADTHDGAGIGFGAAEGGVSQVTRGDAWPRAAVVFNPLAAGRTAVATLRLWDSAIGEAGDAHPRRRFVVRTGDGEVLPAQRVGKGSEFMHHYVEVAFPVRLDALGYAAVAVEPVEPMQRKIGPGHAGGGPTPHVEGFSAGVAARTAPVSAGEGHAAGGEGIELENEHLRLRFDSLTGGIVSLLDKAEGVDLARAEAPMGVLEVVTERAGGMTAWRTHPPRRVERPEAAGVGLIEHGPHRAAVEARLEYGDSRITVRYALSAGARRVEVAVVADWLERGDADRGVPALRMVCPTRLEEPTGRYETPFGWVDRALTGGEEVPAVRWAQVRGTLPGRVHGGLALLNDSVHGHSLDGSTLRATLLRSSYDPDPLPEIGRREFRLAILPGCDAAAGPECVVRAAAELNQPPVVISTDAHAGDLPARLAGIELSGAGVILDHLKKAEDADALILRFCEVDGADAPAEVTLQPALWGHVTAAEQVDLLERPVDADVAVDGNTLRTTIGARGVASVRVTLEEPVTSRCIG